MSHAYGAAPGQMTVRREETHIVVSTPYYAVRHDLARGGAVCDIRYPNGTNENLLVEPMSCAITTADGDAGVFTDLHEASPQVVIDEGTEEVSIRFRGKLHRRPGETSAIGYDFLYRYRWGYVRVRKQFLLPDGGIRARDVCVHQYALRSDLSDWGYRPAAEAEGVSDPFGFGACQWGRCRAGRSFDPAVKTRFVPRTIVNGARGIEGLEWSVSSDLAQWRSQLADQPGQGLAGISPVPEIDGIRIAISALSLPRGDASLSGKCSFDFYHGFPVLSSRAHQPFLHATFNRRHWPTEEGIRSWAEAGIRTAHFHHDGDSGGDGLFWRDGAYPPFGPEDMREYDRVIATCRQYGVRTATYFSNKELHPTTSSFKEHGEEWGRHQDDRGTLRYNPCGHGEVYGAQMCLRSGWLDCLKGSIDKVLTHHELDGVYYDWSMALYCQNPAHAAGAQPAGADGAPSLTSGHWDIDELLDLMEWTRARVGDDGLIIIHNTMVPCAATENFADHVVAMEWGYGRLSTSAPELDDLPLEWDFFGSRPRGVIAGRCIAEGGDETLARQMALRALVTGSVPWPASKVATEVFEPLRDHDLTSRRFLTWRKGAARFDQPDLAACVYLSEESAFVVVANLSADDVSGAGQLDPGVLELTGPSVGADRPFAVQLPPYGACVREIPLD